MFPNFYQGDLHNEIYNGDLAKTGLKIDPPII